MLIKNARVWPPPRRPDGDGLLDVRITDGQVTERAPDLRPAADEEDIDAAGNALLPGLHDHHVHLRALGAVQSSIQAGPPRVRTAAELADALAAADAAAQPGAWLRCVGYHESVAGPLDRWALDRLAPGRPVRVQHRTGALWMLNSAASQLADLDACELPGVERVADGTPTGRLWRMDQWLADRVTGAAGGPTTAPDLTEVSAKAAALGVTGFTEATPGATEQDIAALAAAVAAGSLRQRVCAMAPPGTRFPADDPAASALGGSAPVASVTLGPVKIMLDDDTLPSLDDLAATVRQAHAARRPVAVHCVTRVQLVLALAALDSAGRLRGDRIEHGAVIPAESTSRLRGLTIVTQPHFIAERGEQYAADVDPAEQPELWRLRSLLDAGIAVAAGSDAPFGGADPWHVMRSAASRPALWAEEAVRPERALGLFLGAPATPAIARQVAPGRPADLVLLRVPPAEALRSLASDLVAATFVGGRQTYPGP